MKHINYRCDFSFENAHNEQIRKVISLSNNRIASCSNEHTIKIWNNQTPYYHIATLYGHTDYVTAIIALKHKNVLILGCDESNLFIWSNNISISNNIY